MKVKVKGGVIDNGQLENEMRFFRHSINIKQNRKVTKNSYKKIRNQKMNDWFQNFCFYLRMTQVSSAKLNEVVKEELLYKLLVSTCYQTPN